MRFDFSCLVEQHDVAEFYLLDDKVLDVFLINLIAHQVETISKLVTHAEGIDYSDDAVKHRIAILTVFLVHERDGADGLGDGCGFTDAACLDDDIVECAHLHQVVQLLHEVHLKCAADATVL